MMEGFSDIEGPVPILVFWLIAIIGCLIICGAALLGWLILRKRKDQAEQKAMEPKRTPLEIALDRLQRLKQTGETLEADPYTIEVSDIVRDYLESSLKVPAREQTSEEFLVSLQKRDHLPEALKEQMPTFLNQCDWVKFARQSLGLEERHHLLQTAETVVDVTDSHLRELKAANPSAPVAS